MKLKLFPYKLGSESARVLARSLGILRVTPQYNARRSDVVINWGNSTPPHFRWMEQDLNNPHAIANACDKLKTFRILQHDNNFKHCPDWTHDKGMAAHWIRQGDVIYCRSTTTGHSGRGIVIANTVNELIDAPLYTVATKHKYEYRVHVFKNKVIDVQQKKKRNGTIGGSGIRNYSNGWVYARANVTPPDELLSSACKAVSLLGLDFGAVDIGHRLIDNKLFVFEVNTAPGLTGTTLSKYAQAFNNYLRSL